MTLEEIQELPGGTRLTIGGEEFFVLIQSDTQHRLGLSPERRHMVSYLTGVVFPIADRGSIITYAAKDLSVVETDTANDALAKTIEFGGTKTQPRVAIDYTDPDRVVNNTILDLGDSTYCIKGEGKFTISAGENGPKITTTSPLEAKCQVKFD